MTGHNKAIEIIQPTSLHDMKIEGQGLDIYPKSPNQSQTNLLR
jgi:hypothetical protein